MSYERITDDPKFDGKTRMSHETRYRIAAGYVEQGDMVLDAGCGNGYGMYILLPSKDEDKYLGLDRNPPIGRPFYQFDFENENEAVLDFLEHDIFVGLEAIEHLNDKGVENFIGIAKQAIKWIIISTPIVPNKNPFHKQQFEKQDILDLFVDEQWSLFEYLEQDERYGIFIFKNKTNE